MNLLIEQLLTKKQSTLSPIEDCARRLYLTGQEKRAIRVLTQLMQLQDTIGELTSILNGRGISWSDE